MRPRRQPSGPRCVAERPWNLFHRHTESLCLALKCAIGGLIVEHERYLCNLCIGLNDRFQRGPRGGLDRPAERSSRYRGKSNTTRTEVIGDAERLPVGGRQDIAAIVLGRINRAHGVNDPLRRQSTSGRRYRLPGRQSLRETLLTQASTFGHDFGATGGMYGSIHSTATQKTGIGGIDDGVGTVRRDVSSDQSHGEHCRPLPEITVSSAYGSVNRSDVTADC